MKNILMVSPTNSFDNGAEKSIYYLMEMLVQKGYKLITVCQSSTPENNERHAQIYSEIGVKNYYLNSAKWWWEDAPGGLPGTEQERIFYNRRTISDIQNIIAIEEIDLVITNTVNVFTGAVAAALSSIPHYWLIHEFPDNEFSYYKEKIDFVDSFSTEIFSVAGELNNTLAPLFPNRTIHSFVPYTEITPTPLLDGEKVRLVTVGRLTDRKNQIELIKAFQSLKVQYPQLELVLVGDADQDYKNMCQSYIKEHQIKDVTLTGHKENPWSDLTDKDICVFTSKQETFGLVYVEALLNGLPTLMSDNLGFRTSHDMFGLGGLYEAGNQTDLVEKLTDMIENQSEQFQTAQDELERVRSLYTVEKVYEAITTAIENESDEPHLHPIRHIASLITTTEERTRLERLGGKVSKALTLLKQKLKR